MTVYLIFNTLAHTTNGDTIKGRYTGDDQDVQFARSLGVQTA